MISMGWVLVAMNRGRSRGRSGEVRVAQMSRNGVDADLDIATPSCA